MTKRAGRSGMCSPGLIIGGAPIRLDSQYDSESLACRLAVAPREANRDETSTRSIVHLVQLPGGPATGSERPHTYVLVG